MRARLFSAILLGLLALSAALAPASPAAPLAARSPARAGVQPLDRLLPGIRRAHPGNFYDAEGPTYGPQGDPHYHLKWMTPDGRVIWYDTDARSGRVLRTSPGRDNFDGPPPPGYARPFGGPWLCPAAMAALSLCAAFRSRPGYARPYGGFRPGGWRVDGGRGGGRGRH